MICMFEKLWSGDRGKRWRSQWCYVIIMHWFHGIDREIKMFWHWTATVLSERRSFPFRTVWNIASELNGTAETWSYQYIDWVCEIRGSMSSERELLRSQSIFIRISIPKPLKFSINCTSTWNFSFSRHVWRSTGVYTLFMLSFNVAFM